MDNIVKLNGTNLYYAIISGAQRIINIKKNLNKINVFPIADGDTGTNMSHLMQSIINKSAPSENISETLDSITKAALIGSRGNSGIIFCEYLNGIHEALNGFHMVTPSEFNHAALNGVKRAYHAIMDPVEGTILTVLRKTFDLKTNFHNFNIYFNKCLNLAKKALFETTNELEVLKKNNVVDAGAKGFIAFLEGIHNYIKTGKCDTFEVVEEVDMIQISHDFEIKERYCTEVLFTDIKVSFNQLKETFSAYGSSLIISGDSNKMRMHIHTNHPDIVFAKLREYAVIVEQKIDDMLRQKQAIVENEKKIALVCDSIADIPIELLDKYSIHMIPANLILDDASFLDKLSISTNTFYKMFKRAKQFSSAQPDREVVQKTFEFLLDHYEEIIVVSVSGKMSGTYNMLYNYAKDFKNIHIIDSKTNSGAEGLIVYQTAKLIEQGKSVPEIKKIIAEGIKNTKIYVSVNTLKYMVKQGRVKKTVGIFAKITNLKPVISIDKEGNGIIAKKSFSLRGNVKQIIKLIENDEVESYAIVHAMAEKRANKLAKKIEKITNIKPLYTTLISPVVAMNAGLGALAVAVKFKEVINND